MVRAMRNTYKEILAELAESNLLEDILSQLVGYPVKFAKQPNHKLLPALIRASEYALS